MRSIHKCIFLLIILSMVSCYSFKGISIAPGINSYYVEDFTLTDFDSPPDLAQEFGEALRMKVRQESRLTNDENEPDIIFRGDVTVYDIAYVAPEEGNTTSLNRMEIHVKIDYINEQDPDSNWSRTYSDFEDFDANQDLTPIQDELIESIIDDIIERVFNDAFTDW